MLVQKCIMDNVKVANTWAIKQRPSETGLLYKLELPSEVITREF